MKTIVLVSAAALAAVCGLEFAHAFMRFPPGGGGYHGGGLTATVSHTGDAGGFEHATQVGPNGVAHESDAGGAWHGSAANSYGAYHGSDYGGYYHSTTADADGVYHTGVDGAYYHQPAVVNAYGGCYNCGVGGLGRRRGGGNGGGRGHGGCGRRGQRLRLRRGHLAHRRHLRLSPRGLPFRRHQQRALLRVRRDVAEAELWRERRDLSRRRRALTRRKIKSAPHAPSMRFDRARPRRPCRVLKRRCC